MGGTAAWSQGTEAENSILIWNYNSSLHSVLPPFCVSVGCGIVPTSLKTQSFLVTSSFHQCPAVTLDTISFEEDCDPMQRRRGALLVQRLLTKHH